MGFCLLRRDGETVSLIVPQVFATRPEALAEVSALSATMDLAAEEVLLVDLEAAIPILVVPQPVAEQVSEEDYETPVEPHGQARDVLVAEEPPDAIEVEPAIAEAIIADEHLEAEARADAFISEEAVEEPAETPGESAEAAAEPAGQAEETPPEPVSADLVAQEGIKRSLVSWPWKTKTKPVVPPVVEIPEQLPADEAPESEEFVAEEGVETEPVAEPTAEREVPDLELEEPAEVVEAPEEELVKPEEAGYEEPVEPVSLEDETGEQVSVELESFEESAYEEEVVLETALVEVTEVAEVPDEISTGILGDLEEITPSVMEPAIVSGEVAEPSDEAPELDSAEVSQAEPDVESATEPQPELEVHVEPEPELEVQVEPEPEPEPEPKPEPEPARAYEAGGSDITELTCDDCIYMNTCPKKGESDPSSCGSFQWRSI